jgi:hypothetical protein
MRLALGFFLGVVLSRSPLIAFPAVTGSIPVDDRIRFVESVPVNAMGDRFEVSLHPGELRCFAEWDDPRTSAVPPSLVFSLRDGFKMCRIYARPNAAEMVKDETFGNWSYEQFVSHAMGEGLLTTRVTQTYGAVTVFHQMICPDPATARIVADLLKEFIQKGRDLISTARRVHVRAYVRAESKDATARRTADGVSGFHSRFPRIDDKARYASHWSASQIFGGSNRLKMGRIAAESNAAYMIDVHPRRDRSDVEFISDTMGQRVGNPSVSQRAPATCPDPATCVIDDDFAHQSIDEQKSLKRFRLSSLRFSHVTLLESRWSGSHSVGSAVVARLYFKPVQGWQQG